MSCIRGHTIGRDRHGNCITCVREANNRYHSNNREKCRKIEHKWRNENREWKRTYYFKTWRHRKYGLVEDEYHEMLIEQAGLCAICDKQMTGKFEPMVDHDHLYGHVRALLCAKCNLGLHYLENYEFKQRAQLYLDDHAYKW